MQLNPTQAHAYQAYKDANIDPYGAEIIAYSERWADLMETRMAAGEALTDIANETSHKADTNGITGFMYGCAVQGLAKFWLHGEALRQWHNLKTQLGNKGQEANQSGGTLNPALLSIESN